jgi:hypothetical protein
MYSHACCCQCVLRQLLHLLLCPAAAAAAAAAAVAVLLAQLAHLHLRQLCDGVTLQALADLACHVTDRIQVLQQQKEQQQKQWQTILMCTNVSPC